MGVEMEDKDLDAIFALAQAAGPQRPSEDLMARVLADALAEQPSRFAVKAAPEAGLWARVFAAFGGLRLVAGVAAAAFIGLGLGYLDPLGVMGGSSAAFAGEFELIPIAEPFFDEGVN